MKKYISFNVTLRSADISMLLKSSDSNVVNFIKSMVHDTILREFASKYTKYGLIDEPLNYYLIDKATENIIKELSSWK